jgi:hypothetical protein
LPPGPQVTTARMLNILPVTLPNLWQPQPTQVALALVDYIYTNLDMNLDCIIPLAEMDTKSMVWICTLQSPTCPCGLHADSTNPHRVHAESTRSPQIHTESVQSLQGVHMDSTDTENKKKHGVPVDSASKDKIIIILII